MLFSKIFYDFNGGVLWTSEFLEAARFFQSVIIHFVLYGLQAVLSISVTQIFASGKDLMKSIEMNSHLYFGGTKMKQNGNLFQMKRRNDLYRKVGRKGKFFSCKNKGKMGKY